MEAEELVLSVKEFLESPEFLSMTNREQKNFIKNGVPLLISIFVGLKMFESVDTIMELDKLKKELDLVNLELLWNKK